MNVTLALSTPERPEVHALTYNNVLTIRYTANSKLLDMAPGLQLRFKDHVERFDLSVVLDVLIS